MSRSGPFSAAILLIPTIAAPLLAVFGVPQFPSVVASSSATMGDDLIEGDDVWPADTVEKSSEKSSDESVSDNDIRPALFQQVADADDQAGWSMPERSTPKRSNAVSSASFESTASSMEPEADANSAWRRAIQRLNRLGIDDYRLEPGAQPHRFLFVCSHRSSRDSHIVLRFEAESNDPLDAVEQVLRQIEQSRQRATGVGARR